MSEIPKHWIDGEWVGSDTVAESVNPATGAVLGQWADGGAAEARATVAAARRAFETHRIPGGCTPTNDFGRPFP